MILKPQDVVILLKLSASRRNDWTYQRLGHELAMSSSEVHAGIRRAHQARLATEPTAQARPVAAALEEFLVHGLKYAFPPDKGQPTRGMPTGYAAPPLNKLIVASDDPPPVWPTPDGEIRGYALAPLYKTVPKAAKLDAALYELLALVDAIREGRARERALASREIAVRLEQQ
jgi:hypothetical protein